jgi:vacuolar-type H+-ATPase subunit I/STV1
MEYDSRDVEEHEDTFDNFDIFDFGNSSLDNSTEGPLTFVDVLIPLDELPEVRVTEEEFVEFAQHMDEHFDFEEEVVEESEEREELGETEKEFKEEYEEEFKEEEIGEELAEESGDRPERRTRRRDVVSNTNVNSVVSNSIANSYAGSNSSSTSSTTASAVSGGSSASSVSSSPSISDQIASAQVQTNNVLQSIEILPVPTMDNTPSVMMAEVQVTSMENQIESVTSTMVTSSEAEQIAEEIVANNIRAQQEQSQAQQEESGQYDSQGQSNLIAYMNYVPNFSDYTSTNITDQTNWYTPTVIYASVTLEDNAGYSFMVSDSMNTLQNMTGQQSTEFFIDRR